MVMGRPREFDAGKALDQALALFWEKGYEGTSLADLIQAMGINKPSLYAAFGGKEDLFFKALARYQERLGAYAAPNLAMPSVRDGIAAFLRALAEFQSSPETPPGCLLVQGALAGSEDSKRVAKVLCEVRESGVQMMRASLERALQQGELPPDTDIDALARYFGTVSQGISVQAASRVPTDALHRTIAIAMGAWPTPRVGKGKKGADAKAAAGA